MIFDELEEKEILKMFEDDNADLYRINELLDISDRRSRCNWYCRYIQE